LASRCKQATKQVGAIAAAAAAAGVSNGSHFGVVFQHSLLIVSFGGYPLNSSRAYEQVFQLQDFCFCSESQ